MKFFKPKKVICRNDNKPLLIRWNIFECKYFSIKIHKLVGSDPACLHDHPWTFITFLLSGGYVEHTEKGTFVRSRFSLLYRPASYAHKLEVHQPVYTIVLTLKKVRNWGFLTPKGWLEWWKYNPSNTCE